MTDRRYGSPNKYGNGRLYGASDAPIVEDRFQWGVDVAWTGSYGGTNEAQYMTSLYLFRGRRNWIQPNGQGFAPVETGTARVTLDNSTGRYDGWNTSSALYPNVKPGGDIRIRVRDLDSGTTYTVFAGLVLDIETIGYGANAKVVLVCEDYWYYLRNMIVFFIFARTGFTVSQIIGDGVLNQQKNPIFTPFKWKYGTAIDNSGDALTIWWSSNNILASNMLHEVSSSFFGKFFIARDGTATYYDRTNARSSVATYTQSQILKDIGNSQPWINQRNSLRIKVHPRVAAANQKMWGLSAATQVLSGQSLTLNAVLTYSGIVTPGSGLLSNPTTDYTMNTAADGSGTNLTNGFIVANMQYGDTISMRLTNDSGADGYVTKFEWVGIPFYETGVSDIVYPPNPNPQTRELLIDTIWHQSLSTAATLVAIYGPQITAVRQFPIITFDTRPEALVPDLFDIVTVSLAALGVLSTDFEVGGIEIQTTHESCQSFLVTQYLEPHLLNS